MGGDVGGGEGSVSEGTLGAESGRPLVVLRRCWLRRRAAPKSPLSGGGGGS